MWFYLNNSYLIFYVSIVKIIDIWHSGGIFFNNYKIDYFWAHNKVGSYFLLLSHNQIEGWSEFRYMISNVSYVMEFLARWVQKSKVFTQKSTVVKWNCCVLWIDIAWGLQKLGLILKSKVVQKLSPEKNVFNKKWSPKLILLDDFFLKKFSWFLTLKIDFESTILSLFLRFSTIFDG